LVHHTYQQAVVQGPGFRREKADFCENWWNPLLKISENTNLIVTMYDEEGEIYAYAHSTPVSYEVFELNYRLISRTYAAILENGAQFMDIVGPKTAAISLREAGRTLYADEQDPAARAEAFLAEIRRLTTIVVRNDAGYQPVPFTAAVDRKMITVPDAREVESAIVFFTVCWHMLPRPLRANLCRATLGWGGQTSSLSTTEFIASLRTSSVAGSSGAMAVE
jgi:hypothetical protein